MTNNMVFSLLLAVFALFHGTVANTYCYDSLADYYCRDNEYCCGNMQCCYYYSPVYSFWWFWLVVCLVISAICSCIGCCVRARRRNLYLQNARVGGVTATPRLGTEVTVTVPPPTVSAPPSYGSAVYGYNQPSNYAQAPPSYQPVAQPVKN